MAMTKENWREKIIPDAETDEEAEKVYYNFYTKKQEKKYWVLALELILINKKPS